MMSIHDAHDEIDATLRPLPLPRDQHDRLRFGLEMLYTGANNQAYNELSAELGKSLIAWPPAAKSAAPCTLTVPEAHNEIDAVLQVLALPRAQHIRLYYGIELLFAGAMLFVESQLPVPETGDAPAFETTETLVTEEIAET